MDHPGGVCVLDGVGTNSRVNIINLWNSVYLSIQRRIVEGALSEDLKRQKQGS